MQVVSASLKRWVGLICDHKDVHSNNRIWLANQQTSKCFITSYWPEYCQWKPHGNQCVWRRQAVGGGLELGNSHSPNKCPLGTGQALMWVHRIQPHSTHIQLGSREWAGLPMSTLDTRPREIHAHEQGTHTCLTEAALLWQRRWGTTRLALPELTMLQFIKPSTIQWIEQEIQYRLKYILLDEHWMSSKRQDEMAMCGECQLHRNWSTK